MNMKSAISGLIASVSVILIALALPHYPALIKLVEDYPLWTIIIAVLLFFFRDRLLEKMNVHNGG